MRELWFEREGVRLFATLYADHIATCTVVPAAAADLAPAIEAFADTLR
jgi:hypothetical protein